MDSQSPPPRRSLKEALGLTGSTSTGSAAGSASGSGAATGAAGSGSQDAAAGLGIDEFVDPNAGAGRDASAHVEMNHLPGNALNMVEMYELRERNHVMVQKAARRSGDRRSVRLDAVGLELLRQLQREVERAHFSQAAVSTRGAPKDASEERFADTRAEDVRPRRDAPPVAVWREDAPLPDEDAPLDADPDRPMTSVARERAALHREVLLDKCADAHAAAMSDLAILNQAEGRSDEMRGRQARDLGRRFSGEGQRSGTARRRRRAIRSQRAPTVLGLECPRRAARRRRAGAANQPEEHAPGQAPSGTPLSDEGNRALASKHYGLPIRIASALYSPYASDFTLPVEQQLLQIDCIFSVMTVDGVALGWIDGIDHDDPILVPVRSMEGHSDLGTVEEYLSEEFHTSIGSELQALLRIAREEELTPTVLVRALAILHNDTTIDAAHAVKQSFDWGFTMLRAGVLDRHTYSLAAMLRQ